MAAESTIQKIANSGWLLRRENIRQGFFCQGMLEPKGYNLSWKITTEEAYKGFFGAFLLGANNTFGPKESPRATAEGLLTGPMMEDLNLPSEETNTQLSPVAIAREEPEIDVTPTPIKRQRGRPKKSKKEIGKGKTLEGSDNTTT